MQKTGTFTKAHIIDALMEQNGFIRKKSVETIEILLEFTKLFLESDDDVLIPDITFNLSHLQSVTLL